MMRDLIGQQLGNYRLVSLLGRGGFAEVYLGQHVRLSMQAAVKVLHAHLSDEEIKGFQCEAETIANLIHPHIVRILDFDVSNGIPFLVMDYCPDGTLRKHHPKGEHIALSIVVSYVQQIAEALQFAHDQKHIHRDIKPENMLIGRHNEILLSDFGIAATAHSTSSMSTQMPAGTIPYMAPEQIQAQARPASDQYALGVVVYEWLCGVRPFEGSYTEIFSKHLMTPPPPLRQKVPTIPPEVEQVVLMALSKKPKERFPTVQDFATALEHTTRLKNSSQAFDRMTNTSSYIRTSAPKQQQPLPDVEYRPPASNVSLRYPSLDLSSLFRSRKKSLIGVVTLVALAFLVSICGLIYFQIQPQTHMQRLVAAAASATAKAWISAIATTTVQANVTATARFNATATVRANAIAEATTQYKNVTALTPDPTYTFNGNSASQWENNNSCGVLYGGTYQVTNTQVSQYTTCMNTKSVNLPHNFAYQVNMSITNGGDTGGIIWRSDAQVTSFYRFSLGQDGKYSLVDCLKCSDKKVSNGYILLTVRSLEKRVGKNGLFPKNGEGLKHPFPLCSPKGPSRNNLKEGVS